MRKSSNLHPKTAFGLFCAKVVIVMVMTPNAHQPRHELALLPAIRQRHTKFSRPSKTKSGYKVVPGYGVDISSSATSGLENPPLAIQVRRSFKVSKARLVGAGHWKTKKMIR